MFRTNVVVNDIKLNSEGEYSPAELDRYFNTETRNYLTVGIIAGPDKIPHHIHISSDTREEIARVHQIVKGLPTVVFGDSIRQIQAQSIELSRAGVSAASVHSQLTEKEIDLRFGLYDEDWVKILLGVGMLGIGWDSPKSIVGLFENHTRSGLVLLQELGRLLRPSPETGKVRAIAIQFVDSFRRGSQTPVLLTDLFNPSYVLRGTQRGEFRPRDYSITPAKDRPKVTFSGIHIEAILEESRNRYLLRERFINADVLEMDQILATVISSVRERNPDATSVELYRLFVDEMPYFVSSKNQEEAMQAIASIDSNVSDAGRRVLSLLYMKTILNAAEQYLSGDPDTDSDLIHSGITHLLTKVSNLPAEGIAFPTSTYINHQISVGVTQELSSRLGVPVTWVKEKDSQKVIKRVNAAFDEHPYGLNPADIQELAANITAETGLAAKPLETYIEYRNSQIKLDEIVTETDVSEEAFRFGILPEAVEDVLQRLSTRERLIFRLRQGFSSRIYTLKEVSNMLSLSVERTRQIEAETTAKLQSRPFKQQLRPYHNPEYNPKRPEEKPVTSPPAAKPITPRQIWEPKVNVPLLGRAVSKTRWDYRYSDLSLHDSAISAFDKSVVSTLSRGRIHSFKDLITKTENQLRDAGLDDEGVEKVRIGLEKFLDREAHIVTIADRLFRGR